MDDRRGSLSPSGKQNNTLTPHVKLGGCPVKAKSYFSILKAILFLCLVFL